MIIRVFSILFKIGKFAWKVSPERLRLWIADKLFSGFLNQTKKQIENGWYKFRSDRKRNKQAEQ